MMFSKAKAVAGSDSANLACDGKLNHTSTDVAELSGCVDDACVRAEILKQPMTNFESLIKAQAYSLGFDLAGITDLGPAATTPAFDEWLARGYAGEMSYMQRTA